ncbi:MAG TPA: hypothetical protein VEO19_12550 [Terriglobia bacterium]|nr:hypothetical protein [Terriglobia bacterium]
MSIELGQDRAGNAPSGFVAEGFGLAWDVQFLMPAPRTDELKEAGELRRAKCLAPVVECRGRTGATFGIPRRGATRTPD